MTNEEKATEISLLQYDMICGYDYPKYASAMEMAQWKDEQHKQEKQKLIDEACKWLFENDSYAIPTNVQVDRLREHLNNIK